MSEQAINGLKTAKLPSKLTMPSGVEISTEDLVSQLALLRAALGNHFNEASRSLFRDPLTYPEIHAYYNIATTAYYALAGTLYAEEIAEAAAKDMPEFV